MTESQMVMGKTFASKFYVFYYQKRKKKKTKIARKRNVFIPYLLKFVVKRENEWALRNYCNFDPVYFTFRARGGTIRFESKYPSNHHIHT